MNLRHLQAILAAAELGSVTAAAIRMRLTQSAVSRIIATTEAELGIALFERHKRRLIPSKHAAAFMTRAARIVSDVHELEASARNIRHGRAEHLRIISVPPFLLSILPQAIARRIKTSPQLCVRVDAARRLDIPDWITRRDFDIALTGLPVDRPEVKAEPLPPVEAVAVLPRKHRLSKQPRVGLQQLIDGPLVTHTTGPLMRVELDRVLAGQGLRPAPVVEASSAWIVCAMVAAGAGTAIVDPFTARAHAGPELIVRPLKQTILLHYGLLTLRERPLVGEAAALAQDIREEVRATIKAIQKRRQ